MEMDSTPMLWKSLTCSPAPASFSSRLIGRRGVGSLSHTVNFDCDPVNICNYSIRQ